MNYRQPRYTPSSYGYGYAPRGAHPMTGGPLGDVGEALENFFSPTVPNKRLILGTPLATRPPKIQQPGVGVSQPRRSNSDEFSEALTRAALSGNLVEVARLKPLIQEALRVENAPAPDSASASAQYTFALLHNAPDDYTAMLAAKVDLAHLREAGVLDVPLLQKMQQTARARGNDREVLLIQALIDESLVRDRAVAKAEADAKYESDRAAAVAAENARPLFIRWRDAAKGASMQIEEPFISQYRKAAEDLRLAYLMDTNAQEQRQNAVEAAKALAAQGVPPTNPELVFLQKLASEADAKYQASLARAAEIKAANQKKRDAAKAVKIADAQAKAEQVKAQAKDKAEQAQAKDVPFGAAPTADTEIIPTKKNVLRELGVALLLTAPAWMTILLIRGPSR